MFPKSMLTLEQCREYVGDEISNEQLEQIRDALYAFAGGVLNAYFDREGTTDLQDGSNDGPIDQP